MKVLSAAEMNEVDRLTTEKFGVPSLQLMENAASRTVEAIAKRFGDSSGKHVLVICGRGNNGGDGAAIARLLNERGASVEALVTGRISETHGDARTNFERAKAIADAAGSELHFSEIENSDQLNGIVSKTGYDLVIDAMFGTGLTRPAGGLFKEAIDLINEAASRSRVVSVDVPSGLASDSPELIGPAVKAHLTVTFTAPKIATVLPPASELCGELIIAPIGSPEELIAESGSRLNLIEEADVERWLVASRRTPQANKGDVGKVLVVAGSRGKTGAACLTGEAALRAGCGLVTIATAESSQPVVATSAIPECMTEPLVETESGSIGREALDRVLELAAERDVIAIGPGLGSTEASTREFVRAVALAREQPIIIDADALNSLAPWNARLRGSEALPMVLTPHPGEMARLVGLSVQEVVGDRIRIASGFAQTHGVILVLKGNRTLIASTEGELFVNPTGNAGMATGGTGDVLTGMIAGLVAQRPGNILGAAISAVYLHGRAGDIAASKVGLRSMIASDITAHLGEAFLEVGGDAERFVRK